MRKIHRSLLSTVGELAHPTSNAIKAVSYHCMKDPKTGDPKTGLVQSEPFARSSKALVYVNIIISNQEYKVIIEENRGPVIYISI